MLRCGCCRCESLGFPMQQLQFKQGVAEELPIEDGSQDAVIGTLVRKNAGSGAAKRGFLDDW